MIEMPKARNRMKGRPITGEEFERMLAKVADVRPSDTAAWERLLTGLWWSGLQIGEAVALDWVKGPFRIDLDGKHPAFRIDGEGQKSGRAEICPITPDFAEWILQTPESERQGRVFDLRTGKQEAGRTVSAIGEKAGVLVDPESGKTASAHDLRRSFGSRWARRVMPAVLQRLMRHASIQTTMGFYVDLDADEVAAELWADHRPAGNIGNTSGNIGPEQAKSNTR